MSLGQKEIAQEMFLSITGRDPEAWFWKEEAEKLWDDWISRCADENRYLYFAGVKDGLRIYRMMLENE